LHDPRQLREISGFKRTSCRHGFYGLRKFFAIKFAVSVAISSLQASITLVPQRFAPKWIVILKEE
jgi:hypothetical protein